MKILHIITVGRVAGGAEKNMFFVNKIHEQQGHIVRVLSSDLDKAKGLESNYTFKAVLPTEKSRFIRQMFNIDAYLKLRRILKEFEPDIVHIHTLGQVSPLPLLLLKKHKIIVHLHGPDEFIPSLILWYLPAKSFRSEDRSLQTLTTMGRLYYCYYRYLSLPVYKLVLKNTKLYIAPSKYIERSVEKDLHPVKYLPSGIQLKKYCRPPSSGPILFVGRLEKVKGIEYLILAMEEVANKIPKARLIILGSGGYEQDLKKLVNNMGLSDRIEFAGWVNQSEIESYYKECLVLVIPSVWPETFGNIWGEAMSIGRPVIATRVGGLPEFIKDSKNGLLVPARNPQALAKAIIKVYSDKELAKRMGRKGYEMTKGLDFIVHAKKLLIIYKKIVDDKL